VALIDGSNLWTLLKKAKGDKRREMVEEQRKAIVDALTAFEPSDICKIFPREHFYYNTQSLTLTEIDIEGNYVKEPIALKPIKSVKLNGGVLTELSGLDPETGKALKDKLKAADIDEDEIIVTLENGTSYHYDSDKETMICEDAEGCKALGCGIFKFDLSTSKGKKSLRVDVITRTTGDYEIIPHHFDEWQNKQEIDNFMAKYVFKPFELGGNTIGVELNFNKEFYVPEEIEKVEDLMAEIKSLNDELKGIEL
jgi:type I restriction enzyme M protein